MVLKKIQCLLLSLLLLVLALAFTAALNASSLKRVYTRLVTAEFHVVGIDTQRKVEKAVQFGKILEKFLGLEQLLTDMKARLPRPSEALVLLPDGRPIYSDLQSDKAASLGRSIAASYAASRQADTSARQTGIVLEANEAVHLLFPIHGQQGVLQGIVVLRFPESLINKKIYQVLREQAVVLALTAGAAALALLLGLFTPAIPAYEPGGALLQRHPYIPVIAILLTAQVFFTIQSVRLFHRENIGAIRQHAGIQAAMFGQDLETKILGRGISITRLKGIERQFADIIAANPDLESMQIIGVDGRLLNMADGKGAVDVATVAAPARPTEAGAYAIDLALKSKSPGAAEEIAGYLRVNISVGNIGARVKEVLLDGLTVLLLSLLFLLEMKFYLLYFMTRMKAGDGSPERPIEAHAFARPAAFLFLFAWAMPLSFLPLKMQLLYQPIAGLSKDVVLGLPISAEMLCALITALIAGGLTDRRGWHFPFVAGVILSLAGCYLSALADSGIAFTACRGVTGLGYGLAWMAIQGFIFHNSDETNRALGYSTLVAGIFAGHICGTAVGAMLAERVGYDTVLQISAICMAAPLLFAFAFMHSYMRRPPAAHTVQDYSRMDMLRLLFNRNFLAILLCSVIPFSICQVGLLYYAAPLYLKEQGISQSSIGRVLMVYGLSVIFIAPLLSRLVDRALSKARFIVLGGIVGSLGLLSLYFVSGLTAVLAAVFALGVSSSLAGPAQPALTLRIRLAQNVGTGRSMSIQRAADKLGQMAGPLFVGLLVTSVGLEKSVAFTGLAFLATTALFLLIFRDEKRQ